MSRLKKTKRSCSLAACAAFCVVFGGTVGVSDDQPQWGQRYSRNMVSKETGLPSDLGPNGHKNLKWSVPLGNQTYSTPVVASGKVLIGTNNENPRSDEHRGDRGVLLCLDEKDGHLLWQLVVPKAEWFEDWPRTGIASPATVEGDRVYQLTNRGEIVCLDLEGMSNGNDGPFKDEARHMTPEGEPLEKVTDTDADILWLYDLHEEVGINQHDSAYCSILQHGPFLYACTSNGVDSTHLKLPAPDAPSLVVLDKMTGRLVATDKEHIGPKIIHCTWSSPSIGNVNGRPLVFFGGGDAFCYGFEPPDTATPSTEPIGLKRIWRFDCDPSAPKKDILKYQDNRRVGPSHISGMPVFHQGRIYITVGGDIWHGKRKAWLKCIDATKTGDVGAAGELWSHPVERHCVSTPSVHNGLVFVADCGRNVHCVDAVTGKPYWMHHTDGEIWCSTLIADGKVYVGTRRGGFWVFAAGKEKKVLSNTKFGDPIHGSPVAANGVLYVTTMSRLYAFQKEAPAN